MSLFSERKCLTKVRTQIQVESMDERLKNRLWNTLDACYWSNEHGEPNIVRKPSPYMISCLTLLWGDYFKQPVDIIHGWWSDIFAVLRSRYIRLQWYEVYDLIEFVANNFPNKEENKKFMQACNSVLEGELSAYRFIDGRITEITSKQEIAEVEQAINSPVAIVNTHLQGALALFSDRQSPDYRNSIKESISAVEALCRLITKNPNATLGDALNAIERQTGGTIFHPALTSAFHKLYGYTNDADGIRHALKDEKVKADFDETKFMLVTCSAFVNYLISKATKAGIKL